MRVSAAIALAAVLSSGMTTPAAADAPVHLFVKPVLCVLDHGATSCAMTFDIHWKSDASTDVCLNDGASKPLRCWTAANSGQDSQERAVAEDFAFWLSNPAGTTRLTEVKISVLRVDSADRRRERRARHVWDVL